MRGNFPAAQPDHIGKAVGYQFYGKAADRKGMTLEDVAANRVAWVQGQGIAADSNNARHITGIMEAHHAAMTTGRRGRPLKSPLVHFSVNFDPKEADKATPEKQQAIAAAIIERMGLAGHVGIVVAHKDTAHPHMHFLFHRIGQDGKAWEEWTQPREDEQGLKVGRGGKVGSHERLLHHTRELAREHGFNMAADRGKGMLTEAEYFEAKREGRQPFRTLTPEERGDIRQRTLGAFQEAKGWGDLSQSLKAEGLRLGMAGKGAKAALYVYTEDGKAKLSDVFGKHKDIRTAALRDRFGQSFTDYAAAEGIEQPERRPIQPKQPRERVLQDGIEHARQDLGQAVAEREAFIQQAARADEAEQAAQQARQSLGGVVQRIEASDRAAEAARQEIADSIEAAFTDPAAARKAWEAYAKERTKARHLAEQAFKPEGLGALRGTVRAGFKDRQRKQALAALERMKSAQARFVAAAEKAEAERVQLPKAEKQERDTAARARDLVAAVGGKEERQAKLADLNQQVRDKAAALAGKVAEAEAEREAADFGKEMERD